MKDRVLLGIGCLRHLGLASFIPLAAVLLFPTMAASPAIAPTTETGIPRPEACCFLSLSPGRGPRLLEILGAKRNYASRKPEFSSAMAGEVADNCASRGGERGGGGGGGGGRGREGRVGKAAVGMSGQLKQTSNRQDASPGQVDHFLDFHMAPMQCYTNRFFRYLLRKLSSKAITWTEMEKASDILSSDSACERRLRHSADEGPMAVLQLGGSDVGRMARAAALGSKYGFGEININCGCPSIETGGADYGAALMSRADTVRQVCHAVAEESGLPVSIKCRVGTFERLEDMPAEGGTYEQLSAFVDEVSGGGTVTKFYVHARAAIMGGLSPSKNRAVPPLQHGLVHRLARERPDLNVVLNGGLSSIQDLKDAAEEASGIRGVMAGRWLLQAPLDAAGLDAQEFLSGGVLQYGSMARAIEKYRLFCEAELASGTCSLGDALTPLVLVVEQLRDGDRDPEWASEWEIDDAIEAVQDAAGALTSGKDSLQGAGLKKVSLALRKRMGTKVYNKVLRNRGEAGTGVLAGADE